MAFIDQKLIPFCSFDSTPICGKYNISKDLSLGDISDSISVEFVDIDQIMNEQRLYNAFIKQTKTPSNEYNREVFAVAATLSTDSDRSTLFLYRNQTVESEHPLLTSLRRLNPSMPLIGLFIGNSMLYQLFEDDSAIKYSIISLDTRDVIKELINCKTRSFSVVILIVVIIVFVVIVLCAINACILYKCYANRMKTSHSLDSISTSADRVSAEQMVDQSTRKEETGRGRRIKKNFPSVE